MRGRNKETPLSGRRAGDIIASGVMQRRLRSALRIFNDASITNSGFRRAGSHRLHWDGRDDDDRPLASGTYLYRLVTTDGTVTRKLTLLR